MRKLLPLMFVIAGLVAAPATAATKTVTITGTGFVPKDVAAQVGDTVTWTNSDKVVHQVVFDRVPSCNLVVQPSQQGSCTFRTVGKFNYRDPSQTGSFRGTIDVKSAPAGVTLQASSKLVAYAGAVTFSGAVSSRLAGERVIVESQECGKTAFTRVATVTSTTDGAWSFVAKPTLNTTYHVRYKTATSPAMLVKVRPRIALRRIASGRFSARVTAAQTFVGKYVLFQRYNRALSRWVTIKRVVLRKLTAGTPPTMVSSATFRARVRKGLRLRLFMPQAQVGACLAPGPSNTIRT